MDLKTVVPSQFMAERGSNLVVVNPGSANVRMGFASQDVQFKIPHCIARRINPQQDQGPRFSVRDQMLNCHATSSMNAERERAYDIVKEQTPSFSFWTMFPTATLADCGTAENPIFR